ncbi:MAG: WcaF family extracellular polysaccharide biosynthesis acetyltransferase [Firmicutes bacterium]|nr:WcaF family extracellular polysaccharide biosynthesis acetyltransferase [Bacillota bacterium]
MNQNDATVDDVMQNQTTKQAGDWPADQSVPVSVLVPVKNESANIVGCLDALSFADQIVVIDSQSTDDTVKLAENMGAEVVQFHYSEAGWPKKKNWALENVPWKNEWVLIMDADERMTPELAREIEDVVLGRFPSRPNQQAGGGDGFYINRRFIFMGRWIKHCGYYPSYNIRLFKHKIGRYERIGDLGDTGSGDNEVHEHVVLRNGSQPGYLANDFDHYAYPNLEVWIEKHNRYSNWEAHAMLAGVAGELHASLTKGSTERRRWIKHKVRHLPFRPTMRFLYSFVIKLGFLDGYPGYVLSRLMSWYEFVSLAKRYEMHYSPEKIDTPQSPQTKPSEAGKSESEPQSTSRQSSNNPPEPNRTKQMQPEASPWPFRDKVARAVWMLIGQQLMRFSFHNWYAYRRLLLRLFGAKIGKNVVIRPSVHIEIPWMLEAKEGASIGDNAIIYCLGKITIGERAIISQYAHLCAGTHDYTDHTFKLIRTPIIIGDDCWVGTDAFIGPGVEVGTLSVVGARSSVYKNIPPSKVAAGNPAKVIKDRELR